MLIRSSILVLLLCPALRAADPPSFTITEPPKSLGLDPFYKKCIELDGLPIVSSEKASDYALKEAAYLVGRMLEGRRDVVDAMVKNKVRVAVMAYSERTVDIPEHSNMKPAGYWNRRARGLGGRTTSCGEENLLNYPGNRVSRPRTHADPRVRRITSTLPRTPMKRFQTPGSTRNSGAVLDAAPRRRLWKLTCPPRHRDVRRVLGRGRPVLVRHQSPRRQLA